MPKSTKNNTFLYQDDSGYHFFKANMRSCHGSFDQDNILSKFKETRSGANFAQNGYQSID